MSDLKGICGNEIPPRTAMPTVAINKLKVQRLVVIFKKEKLDSIVDELESKGFVLEKILPTCLLIGEFEGDFNHLRQIPGVVAVELEGTLEAI